jgi:hypothetical protein
MEGNGSEKLAGHAPATMVGGMRVGAGHHTKNDKELTPVNDAKENVNTNISESTLKDGTIVNQHPIRIQDAFPTEAVKKCHEQKMPTHEKPMAKHQQGQLFQPQNKSFNNTK